MIGFISGVLWETWEILKDASVFLIFGFLLAGALAVLVPKGLLVRLVGTGRVRSVLWASVLGAPLPLCPCGDGRIPRRHPGNRGRQYQPYLRPHRPGHDRVSPDSWCRSGHRSRARHEPFWCSASTPRRNPAAAAGR